MDFDATTWATIWATISLVVFFIVAIVLGAHRMIAKILDDRIVQVKTEISEAKRLRAEAEALLADYESKRQSAEQEAAGIVAAAEDEAKRLTEEAAAALQELVARRTRAVEAKIAQAEAAALAEVRARSADLAVEAARIAIAGQMGSKGDMLVDKAIKDVAARLN
jgi:F-type H+-transporting ATPase subunit b